MITQNIAKQFHDTYFGGNWTAVNLKDLLADVTWQEANAVMANCNSIAVLVYHTGYYIEIMIPVLEGKPLVGKDAESFKLPPITNEADWTSLTEKVFRDAEQFTKLLGEFPEAKLWDTFHDGNYGNYYRNLTGIIEHLHYHLGQISLLKKLIRSK